MKFSEGRDTRNRLKAAAKELFTKSGYQRTSIGAIEAAAGLAPRAGAFYRHFPSKKALLLEIGREIIESPADMGFGEMLPLGDTRAELVLIAKGYAKADARQRPLAAVIAEVQRLPEVACLVQAAETELKEHLARWIASKPRAETLNDGERNAVSMMILGGWMTYLEKRDAPWLAPLDDDTMLSSWATHWAQFLDSGGD